MHSVTYYSIINTKLPDCDRVHVGDYVLQWTRGLVLGFRLISLGAQTRVKINAALSAQTRPLNQS